MKTAKIMIGKVRRLYSFDCRMVLLVCLALGGQQLQAQFTADNQTNVISGTTVDYGGNNYYVGYTNSGDVLMIQNGGGLINWIGGMGATYTSSNNLAVVTGAGSFWTNNGYLALSGGDIYYGPGTGNRLVVSNSGTVYSYHGYIGGSASGSVANDSALVSDPGSSWFIDGEFIVGYGSLGDSLVVSNGAFVICSQGRIYSGYALVTGAGSLWTNRASLQISPGTTPSLLIQNGGQVADPSATGGAVWVSDPGSLWNTAGEVDISGSSGAPNFLVLTNGGAILASNLVIGQGTGQGAFVVNGGSATVASLIATNGTTSVLEFDGGNITAGMVLINNGPLFTLGDGVQSATLQMTGPTNAIFDNVWIQTNSTLSGCIVIGGTVLNNGSFVAGCGGRCALMQAVTNNGTIQLLNGTELDIFGPLVNNGSLDATGGTVRHYGTLVNTGTISGDYQDMHDVWTNSAGGKWENAVNWSKSVPTNVLWCVITNAGNKTVLLDSLSATQPQTLSIAALTLSAPVGATNILSVMNSGLATPLQAQYQFNIGTGGQLSVTNGALAVGVLNGQSLVNDGQLLLSAAGLTATNGLAVIGVNGAASVSVSNSTIASGDVVLGNSLSGKGSLSIAGSNSFWQAGTFYLGQSSASNSFSLSGGRMSDFAGQIGCSSGSSNNIALVIGPGTLWSNATALVIGGAGPANRLLVTNGGAVISSNSMIGVSAAASANSVLIADYGSSWSNVTTLLIGSNSVGNSLTIRNGGSVFSAGQKINATNIIGYAAGGNRVLVSDTGSVWRVGAPITVGQNSSGNSLVISNGGLVTGSSAFVGAGTNASGNTAWITDPGSTWTNNNENLVIGLSGSGNSLVITNGGFVQSFSAGALGNNVGSTNNNALVTGSGSYWTNAGNLSVGFSGAANNLTIRDGGFVADRSVSLLGSNGSSSNNSVLVSDSGSLWNPGFQLVVGNSGSGNSLVIDSNALVSVVGINPGGNGHPTGLTVLGSNSTSSNNIVRVNNGASLFTLNSIYVGYQGGNNSLIISGGNVSSTNSLVVGFMSTAGCNNLLELDGGSLVITNASSNAALDVRRGRFVFNSGVLRVDQLILTNACSQFIHNGGTLIIGTNILNPDTSAVGDGIPNGWKQQYGFDPLDPNVAMADPDHDGANNLNEYLAGTNPTNPASVFHLAGIAATNAGVVVTWTTVGGHSYLVQTNNNIGNNAFADFSPVISIGGTNEGTTNYLDSGAIDNFSNRFYRIRIGP